MTGATIAGLLIQFGPVAFQWIEDLARVWTKQLTTEEVLAFTAKARVGYSDYIKAAQDALTPPPQPS